MILNVVKHFRDLGQKKDLKLMSEIQKFVFLNAVLYRYFVTIAGRGKQRAHQVRSFSVGKS